MGHAKEQQQQIDNFHQIWYLNSGLPLRSSSLICNPSNPAIFTITNLVFSEDFLYQLLWLKDLVECNYF